MWARKRSCRDVLVVDVSDGDGVGGTASLVLVVAKSEEGTALDRRRYDSLPVDAIGGRSR